VNVRSAANPSLNEWRRAVIDDDQSNARCAPAESPLFTIAACVPIPMAERARAARMAAFIGRMQACDHRVRPKPEAPSRHARKYAKYAASELGRARSARYEASAAGQERRERYNHARYFRRLRAQIDACEAEMALWP